MPETPPDPEARSEPESVDQGGARRIGRPPAGTRSDAGTFARRLDKLFSTVHPSTGPYSYKHVAQAIEEQSGISMSPNYLWRLRVGHRGNPSADKIAAIAKFFSVSVAYFYDDAFASRVDEQLELVAAARDAGLEAMAFRAAEMSVQDAREAIRAATRRIMEQGDKNGEP